MSGWVKIEKDLESDPRVQRIAKLLLRDAGALHGAQSGNACVTQVVGCLTRLWIYADTHIRDDNSLDMSTQEIDEWLGVPGFCDMLPKQWLKSNGDTVELPEFQEHNGVEAKRRALTQKRMTQLRNRVKRKSVTVASPDLDLDLDQTLKRGGRTRAARSTATRIVNEFALTDERRAIAVGEHLDPDRTFAKFVNYWRAASGAKARKHDWDATWRNWCLSETDRNSANGAKPKRATRFEDVTAGAPDAAHKDQGFG